MTDSLFVSFMEAELCLMKNRDKKRRKGKPKIIYGKAIQAIRIL